MDPLAAVSGADSLAKIQQLKSSAAAAAADPLAAVEGVKQKLQVPSPSADPLSLVTGVRRGCQAASLRHIGDRTQLCQ